MTDRDDTLVAHAFATSSVKMISHHFVKVRLCDYLLAPLLYASSRAKNVPMAKM